MCENPHGTTGVTKDLAKELYVKKPDATPKEPSVDWKKFFEQYENAGGAD